MPASFRTRLLALTTACTAALTPGLAGAATITGWNTTNVSVGPTFAPGDPEQTGVSTVYDRDVSGGVPANAVTNGTVFYDFPEANSPGIKTVDGPFSRGGNDTAGCIMASSGATCDSGFQSGKRFKQALKDTGPIDLVFDTNPAGTSTGADGYQVFQKLINDTDAPLAGFEISLGTGVGGGFQTSSSGDGLRFSSSFEFGPQDANAYGQFPFGLFGDAATNKNFELSGFFDTESRSGFNMVFGEDTIRTDGLFGSYGNQFGPWLSADAVPTGLFWDDDNDATTDDILMAWINGDGMYELRREISGNDVLSLDEAKLFGDLASLETALGVDLLSGEIEDLANVNMNFAVDVAGYQGESFTMRVTPTPVPLPATAPLLLMGFGMLGIMRRRKRLRTDD